MISGFMSSQIKAMTGKLLIVRSKSGMLDLHFTYAEHSHCRKGSAPSLLSPSLWGRTLSRL